MRLDSTLSFVAPGSPLSLVGSAGTNIPSTNLIDLIGSGSGTVPPNIIGNVTVFGEDTGIGQIRPLIDIAIGTSLATSTSCTLNVAIQGAPDNGSNAPGTWQTFAETGPLTAAQCPSGTVIRMDWAAAFPANERPRFLRLLFQVPSGEDFTAGTVAYAVVTVVRDDQANKFTPNNYVVN